MRNPKIISHVKKMAQWKGYDHKIIVVPRTGLSENKQSVKISDY